MSHVTANRQAFNLVCHEHWTTAAVTTEYSVAKTCIFVTVRFLKRYNWATCQSDVIWSFRLADRWLSGELDWIAVRRRSDHISGIEKHMDESLSSLYANADSLRRQIDEGGVQDLQVASQPVVAYSTGCSPGVYFPIQAVCATRWTTFSLQPKRVCRWCRKPRAQAYNHLSPQLTHRYFLIDHFLGDLTEKRFTTVDERGVFLVEAQVLLTQYFLTLELLQILSFQIRLLLPSPSRTQKTHVSTPDARGENRRI